MNFQITTIFKKLNNLTISFDITPISYKEWIFIDLNGRVWPFPRKNDCNCNQKLITVLATFINYIVCCIKYGNN